MRVFDVVGIAVLLGWIGLMGAYAWELNFAEKGHTEVLAEGVRISAGDSWLLLTRENTEVGYVHETRTPIEDGWLLEYDFMMNVSSLGASQMIRTDVKATVDPTAVLRRAQISVQTGSAFSFDAEAWVEGKEVVLEFSLGGAKRTRRVAFNDPPRLAQSAFYQLAARENLEAGEVFEQEYFDPITMGMTSMKFEYVRRHTIDVYDTQVEAFHFVQKVINDEYDVYLDASGEVQIQELPLRIIGARVPNELGQARAQQMQREFKAGGAASDAAISVDDAIGLIRGGGGVTNTNVYQISPQGLTILGDSGAQKVVHRTEDSLRVDTALVAEPLPAAETDESYALAPALAPDELEIAKQIKPDLADASRLIMVEKAVRNLREHQAFDTLTQARRVAILLAVLREMEIPSRAVFGVEFDKEKVRPHAWIQYERDGVWVDQDPSKVTLIPSTRQVQLSAEPLLNLENFESEISRVKVERYTAEPEVKGTDADFN